jgi:hypothetical protein
MPDMQVAIRLRRKARLDATFVFAAVDVFDDDVAKKV